MKSIQEIGQYFIDIGLKQVEMVKYSNEIEYSCQINELRVEIFTVFPDFTIGPVCPNKFVPMIFDDIPVQLNYSKGSVGLQLTPEQELEYIMLYFS